MSVVRIEPEPPTRESSCLSCGGTNRLIHGYMYEDDEPRAIYFMEWCDGPHPRRAAFLTVGYGRFTDDGNAGDRHAYCIEWWAEGMGLTEKPARDRPDLFGQFLPREIALDQPDIRQIWHVCDRVIADDVRAATVGRWLAGG